MTKGERDKYSGKRKNELATWIKLTITLMLTVAYVNVENIILIYWYKIIILWLSAQKNFPPKHLIIIKNSHSYIWPSQAPLT